MRLKTLLRVMATGRHSRTSKMGIFENVYVSPLVCIMDVQAEGFLCVSRGSVTDDLVTDESWTDIFGN